MSALNILQYNVGTRPNRLKCLLAQESVVRHDIIAIQEPPVSSDTGWPHNPGGNFWVVYREGEAYRPRVAMYVNKRIPISKWTESWFSDDVVRIDLEKDGKATSVVNAYVPTRQSEVGDNQEGALAKLREACRSEDTVLVGDFNLHHPAWGGSRVRRAEELAEELMGLAETKGMELATPTGAVTWTKEGNEGTTIDLTFLSSEVYGRLATCRPTEHRHTFRDHTSIETVIMGVTIREEDWKWSWKDANEEAMTMECETLDIPQGFESRTQLERYATYLQESIVRIAHRHGKRVKRGCTGKSWWNPRVQEAVDGYRLALKEKRHPDRVLEARRTRNRVVREEQTRGFRDATHKAAGDPTGLWRMVRWAKDKSGRPPELPRVPPLTRNDGTTASTFGDKARTLRKQFFLPPEEAALADIGQLGSGHETTLTDRISEDEVARIIGALPRDKAPGRSGIPNRAIKMMGRPLARAVTALANGCLDWEYHPDVLKEARTIVLRKPGKPDYGAPKAWRPIALLEVVSKVVEATIAQRLRQMAEDKGMLPRRQMGGRKGRSTETALALLLGEIRTVWERADSIASVLSLDISGAFDRVIRERLVWILHRKGVPRNIYGWVDSFLRNRRTTLLFDGQESECFPLEGGVPQGSPASPILYLFYNSELFENCGKTDSKVDCVGFADDTNLIAFGRSTEENCRRLERAHRDCLRWAERHGAKFAPDKYELMHFTRKRRFNMGATIDIGGTIVKPASTMRVLGVWLDPKLRWNGHLEATVRKLHSQTRALTRLSGSTWGLPLRQARLVYQTVVVPAVAFGALAWHQPGRCAGSENARGIVTKLRPWQNHCLRTITGGYRATPVSTMEAEAHIRPLDLTLDSKVARATRRLHDTGMGRHIEEACNWVRTRLRRRGRARQKRRVTLPEIAHPMSTTRGWADDPGEVREKATRIWTHEWERRKPPWGEIHSRPPNKRNLELYGGLTKARCSILTQIRSGKIGLAGFLHKRKVPGFESPMCECGHGVCTPKHILVHCPRYDSKRWQLLVDGRIDIRKLLTTRDGAIALSNWWLRNGIQGQFRLAQGLEETRDWGET